MKMYYLETKRRGISYMKYENGKQTGLVTFCVETAFYNGLLKERYKGDRSDRKTRKKT
jgi:ribosomal protein S26